MSGSVAVAAALKNSQELTGEAADMHELFGIVQQEPDPALQAELATKAEAFQKRLADEEFQMYLGGTYDKNHAILNFQAGAGGDEAMEWNGMLIRMYKRYAEHKGWKVEEIDRSDGEHGVKDATIIIKGPYAYGYLKRESGTHRLVRISPFSAQSLRHTSFALVDVVPELDTSVELEIDPKDLRIDTYRASGKGGQHVNKTSSAVRITHVPTNIVAASQGERSQHQNKARAMGVVYSKLVAMMEKEKKSRVNELKTKTKPEWGNQIRSYVLHPYKQVKDLRTGIEHKQPDYVLDGDLDMFIEAELKLGGSIKK